MIQALVFDFDGLILETEGPIYQSWEELYQSHGCRLSKDKWVKIIGTAEDEINYDAFAELEEQIGRTLNREAVLSSRREREMEIVLSQPILPGVEGYLQDARRLGLKIGLASSSDCDWVTEHLSRLGLRGYYECIKAADDVPRTKPDPAVYLACLECLGIRGERALALEDSPIGALAAKGAGMFCVAVPNGMTKDLNFDHVDLRLDSLAELPLGELLVKIESLSK
jgi:HAD superfamily hydrolase (TIGR01509 family)